MKNITQTQISALKEATLSRITVIELTKKSNQSDLNEIKKQIPIVRETAYPKDKSETSQEVKDNFSAFLDSIKTSSKLISDYDKILTVENKTISALKYLTYNQNELKEDKKILIIDLSNLENITELTQIPMATFSTTTKRLTSGTTKLMHLKFNIVNADKVVTLEREDALKTLNNLGIECSKDDNKFVSVQHLMRTFVDFKRCSLETYANILDYNTLEHTFVYNLTRVFMGIMDIVTLEQTSEMVDKAYKQQQTIAEMLNNMETIKNSTTALTDSLLDCASIAKMHDIVEETTESTKKANKSFTDRFKSIINSITERV